MISTPCTGICTLDAEARLGLGCGRSLEQIAAWASLSEAERRTIMLGLAGRTPPPSLHAGPVPR